MNTLLKWKRDFKDTNQQEETQVRSISCSLNGKFVLSGFDQTLEVLDTQTGKTLNRLATVHKKGIVKIEISKYGNYFLTIGGNWSVIQWDGSTLEPKKKFTLNSKT